MNRIKHQSLVACYAALLQLYPPNFRRQFGREMLAAFSDDIDQRGPISASCVILLELFPTLVREHLDDRASIFNRLRLMLCVLPPIALYAAAIAHAHNIEESIVFTFWLLWILASFRQTRCRGRACLVRTMLASVVGMLLPLAFISIYQPMFPSFLSLTAPLAIFASTIGLILAAYARLVMEGLRLTSARRAML